MVMGGVVAKAQDDEEIKVRSIMVTANRVLQELFTLPMTVNVVTAEDIAREPYTNVTEILRNIPGISVESPGLAGDSRISIRGESVGRTLILINGIKVIDKDNSTGAVLLTPGEIERIEVIKGPASVLYGAEAIGGVINFITKKGGTKPIAFSQNFVFDTSTESVDIQTAIFGNYKGFNYRVAGNGANVGNRKPPKGFYSPEVITSNYKKRNYSAALGYDWEDNSILFQFDRYESESNYSNGSDMAAMNVLMWFETERQTAKGTLILANLSQYLKKLTFSSSFQEANRNMVSSFVPMGFIGQTKSRQLQYTGTLQTEWSFGSHFITSGIEYEGDDVLGRSFTDYTSPARPDLVSRAKVKQSTFGIFAQDQWHFADNWRATLGARYTWYDAKFKGKEGPVYEVPDFKDHKGSKLVGSFGLVYTINDLAFRAQWSQGHRVPTVRQWFVGNPGHSAGGTEILPNPKLRPETSNNYELGVRYMTNSWDLDLSVYYASTSNLIQYTTLTQGVATYYNANKAKSLGAELQMSYLFENIGLKPYFNASWLRREVTLANNDKSSYTKNPPFQGRFGLKWETDINQTNKFYSDLHMKWASRTKTNISETMGASNVSVAQNFTIYEAWQDVNFTIGVQGGEDHKYNVSLSLRNIFDQAYYQARGSSELPEPGFHAVLGIGFEY
jgi:hemoglobin/transferrin/lactoferrin receptor protein